MLFRLREYDEAFPDVFERLMRARAEEAFRLKKLDEICRPLLMLDTPDVTWTLEAFMAWAEPLNARPNTINTLTTEIRNRRHVPWDGHLATQATEPTHRIQNVSYAVFNEATGHRSIRSA